MDPKAKIAVLKFGGEVAADAARLHGVLLDAAALVQEGWRLVICHGGGPQASALGAALGLPSTKIAGQRVTDGETLEVVAQAIAGGVSTTVVAAALSAGLPALGISAGVVRARRRPPTRVASEGGREVDYGLVGDITQIDTRVLEGCWSMGRTPVLNPIGVADELGEGSGRLNINADTVAAAVAVAVAADHLFAMTGVPGVLRDRSDPSSRIPVLDEPGARSAIADGTIVGGMIPKVEEALRALCEGVGAVHILAAEAGSLAAEAQRGGSRGTALLQGAKL